jgi:hypothetical protein
VVCRLNNANKFTDAQCYIVATAGPSFFKSTTIFGHDLKRLSTSVIAFQALHALFTDYSSGVALLDFYLRGVVTRQVAFDFRFISTLAPIGAHKRGLCMAVDSTSALIRGSFIAAFVVAASLSAVPAIAQEVACEPPETVDSPPPPLPTYEQPPIPAPGYMWTPGNWSWDPDEGDYYWVPGTWVEPPRPGLLWTPGYWAWVGGSYLFHRGYWGPHVGFYGGVSYGYGYTGDGYEGGRWDHGSFFYNRTVNNIGGARITNVYEKNVVVNNTVNNISYNGGKGGVDVKATPEQRTFAKETHFAPTTAQRQNVEVARKDPQLFSKENKGAPPVAAVQRPAQLKGPGVVPAKAEGENATPVGNRPNEEKKPELDNRPNANAPAPNEAKPAQEFKKPGIDQNKPAVDQNKPAAIEEKKPAVGGAKPAVEKPKTEENRIEEKKPAIEEKKPEAMKPMERPAPKAEAPAPAPAQQHMERPPEQHMAPPAQHMAPPAQHPPGKPEEKKKEP